MTDYEEFEMMAGHLRIVACEILLRFFGEPCDDYEEACENCRRWKLLDNLTANPFED